MGEIKKEGRKLLSKWFACRVTSGRKSALYGMSFSYPLYIVIVLIGILYKNPLILLCTTFIALLGIIFPLHPFDYIYNNVVTRLFGVDRIPGRGTELKVNSSVTLLFNLCVITLIFTGIQLNYGLLAGLYLISSVAFIAIQLFSD